MALQEAFLLLDEEVEHQFSKARYKKDMKSWAKDASRLCT